MQKFDEDGLPIRPRWQKYIDPEIASAVLLACVPLALILFVAVAHFYLEGSAKSAYLKQRQQVDLPWYQAAFISVRTDDANVSIKQEVR